MTRTLSIKTNDVTCFRAFRYNHRGAETWCGYLFPTRHVLHVFIEDEDYLLLEGAIGNANLLRISLQRRRARLTLDAPDFKYDSPWPFERALLQRTVDVEVSGQAVLRRVSAAPDPVRYEVVVGMLACPFSPLFDALRDGRGQPSALAAFWPGLPPEADGLLYQFTPLGLALEGALDLRMPDRRDVLLLPRYLPGDREGDIAWHAVPHREKVATHLWEKFDTEGGELARPSLDALVQQLKADAPDPAAWPVDRPRWAMLRWHLITPDSQPFLDHCFSNMAAGVRLVRPTALPGTTVHAEVVAQFWVKLEHGVGRLELEHAGIVCTLTGTGLVAQLNWNDGERNSTLTADSARAALWLAASAVAPPAALFSVTRQTLRTTLTPNMAAPGIDVQWPCDTGPSNATLALAATSMLYGGTLAGAAGIEPPVLHHGIDSSRPAVPQPGWLMLEDGCVQLQPGALPVDRGDLRPAATMLAAAADGTQAFHGGLPLESLGGPPGLTAWVSRGSDGKEPDVALTIDSFKVKLALYDAVLVWRTPGWWACVSGTLAATPRVPPLGAAFLDRFAIQTGSNGDAGDRLRQAIASILFPALWVGRAGASTASGWPLAVNGNGGYTFTIPAAAVRATTLCSAFHDAYFVKTIPDGVQGLGGPLLDPTRGWVGLTHVTGVPLPLQPGSAGLARLATPPYARPHAMLPGWQPAGDELFHPNISGLTLDPQLAKYTFRHGPPILADGYLRARLDGTLGSTVATLPLKMVRPLDDVALSDIPLQPDPAQTFLLSGWLPAPHQVRIDRLAFTLGGADPRMDMTATAGADGTQYLPLRIGSQNDGFATPVSVVTRPGRSGAYLSTDVEAGKPLYRFGQSLAADNAAVTWGDGAGRRWSPFAAGKRFTTRHDEGGVRNVLSQQRRAFLSCGPLGPVELTLNLADVDPARLGESGAWDLSGPLTDKAGSAPKLGPFLVKAYALRTLDDASAEVSTHLALPPSAEGTAQIATGGSLSLRWQAGVAGWNVTPGSARTFEWRVEPSAGAAPAVASVHGSLVERQEQWLLEVDRLSLYTAVGEVILPCCPVALSYSFDGANCTTLAAAIVVDAAGGPQASFTLQYHLTEQGASGAGWRIGPVQEQAPFLRWHDRVGHTLAINFDTGAVQFSGEAGANRVLTLAQAGKGSWLAWAEDGIDTALTGCLNRKDSVPTQLQLAYRWGGPLEAPDALLGPLEPNSWVRVEGSADWRSAGWGGTPALTRRTLCGHLIALNDFVFAFDDRGEVIDHIHCWFDGVELDASGAIEGGVLHALVEHRFVDSAGESAFKFQVPQAIRVRGDRVCGMEASSVILVREDSGDAQGMRMIPQIILNGTEALGACHGATMQSGGVEGTLLRLPLRTGMARTVIRVPAGTRQELSWYPLTYVPEPKKLPVGSPWQERRALAHVLHAKTIAPWCNDKPTAQFDGGVPLPSDGTTLAEWGALATAKGWLHSGLLDTSMGVVATPYYAGTPAIGTDEAPAAAVPVTLYVPDMAYVGGMRSVAHALISDAVRQGVAADRSSVLAWGRDEMVRRSLRTSAFVLAHGRPTLSELVRRPTLFAAIDDESIAAPLPPATPYPRHSAQFGHLRPSEAAPQPPQVLTARTDQDAVVELVDAQPVTNNPKTAQCFRLALNHLVHDGGPLVDLEWQGAALAKRQWVAFDTLADREVRLNMLPLVNVPLSQSGDVTQLVSPLAVDVTIPSQRPGDMVFTRWALRGAGTATGPSVEAGLRQARAGNDSTVTFAIGEAARTRVDGVDWRLHSVTTARKIGAPPDALAGPGIECVAVTPRRVEQSLRILAEGSTAPPLALAVASSDESPEVTFRLLEPLLNGVFGRRAGLAPGTEIAWAVAAGDGSRSDVGTLSAAEISDLGEIAASSAATDDWNDRKQKKDRKPIRAVRLGPWMVIDEGATNSGNGGYGPELGAGLAQLLQLTRSLRNNERHWLLKEGLAAGPLLVLLLRGVTESSYLVAFAIDWRRGCALEQPERVLAVRDGRVLGFGDLAGPADIRLENGQFMLHNTAYVLDFSDPTPDGAQVRAWLFGPDGACSAITESEG